MNGLRALCTLLATTMIACVPGAGDAAWTSRDATSGAGSSAASEALTASAPMTQVPDTLWLLAADPAQDAVRPTDTHDSLVARYGPEIVVREDVDSGEGMMVPGTVLFPGDPYRRLEIQWEDREALRLPMIVSVRGTAWRVWPGLRMFMSLQDVEALNGGPFELSGFGGHYPGSSGDWLGGRFSTFRTQFGRGFWKVSLHLQPEPPFPPGVDLERFENESSFPSSDPDMQRLRPRVVSLQLYASQPSGLADASPSTGERVAGDTLVLVSIGGVPLPPLGPPYPPCDSGGTPWWQRIVFANDTEYYVQEMNRPGCGEGGLSRSDTVGTDGEYRMSGDTLRAFIGGGNEMHDSFSARIFADSAVELTSSPGLKRWARRRASQRAGAPE